MTTLARLIRRMLVRLGLWPEVFALVIVSLAAWGCQIGDTVGPTQEVEVTITQPTPSPTPTPVATPSPGSSAIPAGSYVRVGMFACSCPAARTCSSNSAATLQVGCTAELTATPKGPDGTDLPSSVHGPSVAWSVVGKGAVVQCAPWKAEPFNLSCTALAVGSVGVSASVPGMQPGQLTLTAIP